MLTRNHRTTGARRALLLGALLCAVLVTLPRGALADRGAFSLEGGALVSGTQVPPGLGTGDSQFGSLGGAILGGRYALRNDVEITASAAWFEKVSFYNDNTTVVQNGSSFPGQLQSRVGRISAGVGADYVLGTVWRIHAGGELGWSQITFDQMDLIDVSDPANPHSFGLNLGSRTVNAIFLAPRVGLEWAATDHLSFAITPRLELLFSEPRMTAFTIPITASYSWYGLFSR